jgi:predicted  nucleic acid-binding Zn-ribbon protein
MKKLFTDEEIQDLKIASIKLEARNESLEQELELKTYEIEALRRERLLLQSRIAEATIILTGLINDFDVTYEVVDGKFNNN